MSTDLACWLAYFHGGTRQRQAIIIVVIKADRVYRLYRNTYPMDEGVGFQLCWAVLSLLFSQVVGFALTLLRTELLLIRPKILRIFYCEWGHFRVSWPVYAVIQNRQFVLGSKWFSAASMQSCHDKIQHKAVGRRR